MTRCAKPPDVSRTLGELLSDRDWDYDRIWLLAWRLRLVPARGCSDTSNTTDRDVATALVALLERLDAQA